MAHTVPDEYYTPHLAEITSWLGLLIDGVDSSLLDEWAREGNLAHEQEGPKEEPEEKDWMEERRGLVLMARNALFRRAELIALDRLKSWGRWTRAGAGGSALGTRPWTGSIRITNL